jgi:hypothetical protein
MSLDGRQLMILTFVARQLLSGHMAESELALYATFKRGKSYAQFSRMVESWERHSQALDPDRRVEMLADALVRILIPRKDAEK